MSGEKQVDNAENPSVFEVDELDDRALEEASGGIDRDAAGIDIDFNCPTTTNSGNCVAGCT